MGSGMLNGRRPFVSGTITDAELTALEDGASKRDMPAVKEARAKYKLAHKQAAILSELRPDKAEDYQRQLRSALTENRAELIQAIGRRTFESIIMASQEDDEDICPHCGRSLS